MRFPSILDSRPRSLALPNRLILSLPFHLADLLPGCDDRKSTAASGFTRVSARLRSKATNTGMRSDAPEYERPRISSGCSNGCRKWYKELQGSISDPQHVSGSFGRPTPNKTNHDAGEGYGSAYRSSMETSCPILLAVWLDSAANAAQARGIE